MPSTGADDWRRFLAQPDLHWRTGFSARTLAHSWEEAAGLPPEVEAILRERHGAVELLLAIPEHKTPLPGGRRESQSDLFALVRYEAGLLVCTIEGKVDEPFGETVGAWCRDMTAGKEQRLAYLLKLLGLSKCPPGIHYQLLHRTAAALIEAERFQAASAAMIVHSFSPDRRWFDAYAAFCNLLGVTAEPGRAASVNLPDGRELLLGWACGDPAFLTR